MNKETVGFRFLLSIIRHGLSALSALLVNWGLVDQQLADEFTTSSAIKITAGIIGIAATLWLSYKDKIWEFLKTQVAKLLPPTSSMDRIVEVANTIPNKAAVAKGEISAEEVLPPTVKK